MKGVVRSFKRMRMSPLERVVDNLRYREFKEAGKIAKKEWESFDGRELAENVSEKLAHLDFSQRKLFFDELAKSPEKIKHMLYENKDLNMAKDRVEDFFEERDIKNDLLAALGALVLLCAIVRSLKGKCCRK